MCIIKKKLVIALIITFIITMIIGCTKKVNSVEVELVYSDFDSQNEFSQMYFDMGDGYADIQGGTVREAISSNKSTMELINIDLDSVDDIRIDFCDEEKEFDLDRVIVYRDGVKKLDFSGKEFFDYVHSEVGIDKSINGSDNVHIKTGLNSQCIMKKEFLEHIQNCTTYSFRSKVAYGLIYFVICFVIEILIMLFGRYILAKFKVIFSKLYSIVDKGKINNKYAIMCFVTTFVFGMILVMVYNYISDPYSYFEKEYSSEKVEQQYYKCRKVGNSDYNCYIIGGSNSGSINPDLISDYTGYNCFSMTFSKGNCYNYCEYARYLVEDCNAECIVLHLSSTECIYEGDKNADELVRSPKWITGNKFDTLTETMSFLTKKPFTKVPVDNHKLFENGMYDWTYYENIYKQDPKYYVDNYVVPGYQDCVNDLSETSIDSDIVEDNLMYIEKIKKLCDENDVELIVINGAAFIQKRYQFECNDYYDYLERLTKIVDVWDFSGFTEINKNPYNFYDREHYSYDVADEEIKFVFGDSNLNQDFGVHLTQENIVEYLVERKLDLKENLKELEDTGTIKYNDFDDKSNITVVE